MRPVLKIFVKSYLDTAAWVTCEGANECREFLLIAKERAKKDCETFIEKVREQLADEDAEVILSIRGNDVGYMAAHDFFLTRNHHGAGFWDRPNIYGEDNARLLTEISHEMGEVDVLHIKGKSSKLLFQ